MKTILKAISLLTISFFTFQSAIASHMMGTDMSYVCLGSGKYKIIAKVYRDCRGIPFNSPLFGVYAGTAGGNGCGSYDLSSLLIRTAIQEVSQICDTAKSKCNPVNTGGTGEGVEMHVYEATVDFNKAPLNGFTGKTSCCDVTFYFGQCCRNGAITTGPSGNDFWTTCSINICNLGTDCNNSPIFSNIPIFFACCNQPYRFNHGLVDSADGDSIAFNIVEGLAALPKTSVSYTSPFSYDFPLTPYCAPPTTIKCTPNPNANPTVGFYFNGNTGDMIFTPTKCDEVAVIAVEAIEYRKISGLMREIGRVRRDMQVIIQDCQSNNIPKIYGSAPQCIQEGDSICFDITTFDTLASGQTSGDSIKLTWNNGIKDAQFVITPGKSPSARFCWKAPKGSARGMAYNFSVKAVDNNCPRVAIAYKGFSIYVGNCNRFSNTKTIEQESNHVYPVPVAAGGILHVENAQLFKGNYTIRDLQGRILTAGMISDSGTIDIPKEFNTGLYLLECNKSGQSFRGKIIVNQ